MKPLVLYLLVCRACDVPFALCRSCYHGQVYCGDECRHRGWLENHRVANKRDQQSPEGRRDHADRQREYLARKAAAAALAQAAQAAPEIRPSEGDTAVAGPVATLANGASPEAKPEKVTDHSRPEVSAFPTLPELRLYPLGGSDGPAQAPWEGAMRAPEASLPPRRSFGGLVCILCGRSGPLLDRRREGRIDRSKVHRPHPAPVLR